MARCGNRTCFDVFEVRNGADWASNLPSCFCVLMLIFSTAPARYAGTGIIKRHPLLLPSPGHHTIFKLSSLARTRCETCLPSYYIDLPDSISAPGFRGCSAGCKVWAWCLECPAQGSRVISHARLNPGSLAEELGIVGRCYSTHTLRIPGNCCSPPRRTGAPKSKVPPSKEWAAAIVALVLPCVAIGPVMVRIHSRPHDSTQFWVASMWLKASFFSQVVESRFPASKG